MLNDYYTPGKDYRMDRMKEYPQIQELIVALWEKEFEGNDAKAQALQEQRLAAKKKYPKPEQS